jgi:trimethylamine:corrinoid methyltransferase-like protein
MKGGGGPAQKARDKAIGILEQHKVPPLPDAVLRELDAIVRAVDSQHG